MWCKCLDVIYSWHFVSIFNFNFIRLYAIASVGRCIRNSVHLCAQIITCLSHFLNRQYQFINSVVLHFIELLHQIHKIMLVHFLILIFIFTATSYFRFASQQQAIENPAKWQIERWKMGRCTGNVTFIKSLLLWFITFDGHWNWQNKGKTKNDINEMENCKFRATLPWS